MNFWDLLSLILNGLLLGAVGYLFYRLKQLECALVDEERRLNALMELKQSVDQSIEEALVTCKNLGQELDAKQERVFGTLSALDQEIQKLDQILDQAGRVGNIQSEVSRVSSSAGEGKYAEARKLAAAGASPHEIARKMKIPLGEVELALSLRK